MHDFQPVEAPAIGQTPIVRPALPPAKVYFQPFTMLPAVAPC
jgi:hypothetical protein